MPVGIPKVPFLVPGDDDSSWVELYNRVYQERLLFLGQKIDNEAVNHIAGLMVYLSQEDKTKDINLFINSPGGDVMCGFAIYDVMQYVKAEVQTIAVGLAASMASVILSGGERTKRLAFPHAKIMIHQPASSIGDGQTGECVKDAFLMLKLHKDIVRTYAKRTGRPTWQIETDMKRDYFMSAEEAQAYGIVDMVAGEDS